ncbi:MAG: rRNA pseudouridine synthase [Chitinophaga sp.]|jgi:23S rRNA pseudouridine2605 synthase|nr:rRNA pseudouridine synthase [Chitinophaga sp.]
MTSKGFEKFIKPEMKGAKKKEAIRQEKRKAKAEARAAGEEARRKKWEQQRGIISEERRQEIEERKKKYEKTKTADGKWKIESKKVENGKWEMGSNSKPNTNSKFNSPQTQAPKGFQKTDKNLKSEVQHQASQNQPSENDVMPLNKFIAYSGICGRREAAEFIKQGLVTVNGDIIYEPGFKVRGNEDVKYKGKRLFMQRNLVYLLVNKPKDFITTSKDPQGRKTVLDLIKGATPERVYPVGRLDRNTTGVLLMTNDGELAQKLTHPSFQIKKIYEVKLDKPLAKTDFESIVNGVQLEDGFIKADSLAYIDAKDKTLVGIEIHSGRNRIVRRLFEHLGYDVKNLDRVLFANLTKKNVERGHWRFLNEKEVRLLKYMNQSFAKKK